MDWLTEEDFDKLTKLLNPSPQSGKSFDTNWNNLKKEQFQSRYNKTITVSTKTPTVLIFENGQSFVYRRFDGAAWHTELRNLSVKKPAGLNEKQKRFRDNLGTLFALTSIDIKMQWVTPIDQSNRYDSVYQLILLDNQWHCLIGDAVYEVSRKTHRKEKDYFELGFSTNAKPVFTFEQIEKALDDLIGLKK